MPFKFIPTPIRDLILIETEFFPDERGAFLEAYRQDKFKEAGIDVNFVQDNHSISVKGVVRGLHFQWDKPMAKLMRVTVGKAFIVAVDIRKNSPTLGQWFGVEASAENKKQLFAPAGFARGFCSLTDIAEVQYKCSSIYNPKGEDGIIWNDKHINLKWPIQNPLLSPKDAQAQTLEAWLARPESNNFVY